MTHLLPHVTSKGFVGHAELRHLSCTTISNSHSQTGSTKCLVPAHLPVSQDAGCEAILFSAIGRLDDAFKPLALDRSGGAELLQAGRMHWNLLTYPRAVAQKAAEHMKAQGRAHHSICSFAGELHYVIKLECPSLASIEEFCRQGPTSAGALHTGGGMHVAGRS